MTDDCAASPGAPPRRSGGDRKLRFRRSAARRSSPAFPRTPAPRTDCCCRSAPAPASGRWRTGPPACRSSAPLRAGSRRNGYEGGRIPPRRECGPWLRIGRESDVRLSRRRAGSVERTRAGHSLIHTDQTGGAAPARGPDPDHGDENRKRQQFAGISKRDTQHDDLHFCFVPICSIFVLIRGQTVSMRHLTKRGKMVNPRAGR